LAQQQAHLERLITIGDSGKKCTETQFSAGTEVWQESCPWNPGPAQTYAKLPARKRFFAEGLHPQAATQVFSNWRTE
jgi:hypothetical protein